jgi:glycosyltransferase involved in cell wall biosynthesis
VRILYLADIRFPLERANGIQSMETCHALAMRGDDVTLVVRPDSHTPPRDPFAFYGLERIPGLRIEVAPITGPATTRRVGYLTFAIGRAAGRRRQDLIFTRDLGLASLLLRLPASLRAPVVYESHGIAADVAAALPDLLTGAPQAPASKLRRLARREARVWHAADGYVTITSALQRELTRRFGERPRIVVVPDGVRLGATEHTGNRATDHTERTGDRATGHTERTGDRATNHTERTGDRATDHTEHTGDRATDHTEHTGDRATGHTERTGDRAAEHTERRFTIGYAGHLYPWKGADLVIEAVAALPEVQGVIVGGHEGEPDLARLKAFAVELNCASRVTFTGLIPPPQVAATLMQADVLVLPNRASAISNEFTSPLKLFEYMASGRPIVASDLPSLREVLRDGENALLVQPGNPQALVAAIARIKDDAALGARLAERARDDVREFTWSRRAERLAALFAAVTGAPA